MITRMSKLLGLAGEVMAFGTQVVTPRSDVVLDANCPETDSEVTSEDLIRRIAIDRDRVAYARLFKAFAPKIKAYVMGQGLIASEAEDLTQDVMLSVWRKAHLYEPLKANATTWIYSIARNLRIDLARKAKRVRDLPEDLWQSEPERHVDELLIVAEISCAIGERLRELPQEQRAIVDLTFQKNLSQTEIAAALNIPLGTVKSRLRLAMARLRTEISRI